MRNTASPDLAELLRDPTLVNNLPPEAIPTVLCQLAALQSALAARLLTTPSGNRQPLNAPEHGDRLLTAEEAGPLMGVNRRWLYRHAKGLPFTKRLSRKALRFSEKGLRRWLAARTT